jgi:putative ABC transport system permease protein
MKITHIVRTATTGLMTNKSRSFLTILGIVIGVAAIITIMSLGNGAQALILGQVQGLGSTTIGIAPGQQPKGLSGLSQLNSQSLKAQDLTYLLNKNNVPTLAGLMPIVFGAQSAIYLNQSYNPTVLGCNPMVQTVFNIVPASGQFFSDDDVVNHASVVVLGYKVKNELFGDSDAVGQRIMINNHFFRVVGVLPQKGQVTFLDFDETVTLPYTTAQDYVFGIKYFNRITAVADSQQDVARTAADITTTLREAHHITDPSKDDFFVQTQADLANSLGTITTVLTLFLSAVAAISLIVGGIGIMNIMLVSVTERTREIGLRKSLGATESDVLAQFLIEAMLLTGLGGLFGVLLGTTVSVAASIILAQVVGLNWTFTFPIMGAFLGIGVSSLIGLVFGIYPARQAARKSPMEALRYE